MSVISTIRRALPAPIRARLRRSRFVNSVLQWKYGGDQSKPHPYGNFQFHFDGMKDIGWTLGNLDQTEPEELRFALRLIQERQCRCVWDVGANIGFWSLAFCGQAGGAAEVHAFEPDAANLRLLKRNRDANAIKTLHVHEIGLSSAPARLRFYSDPMTGKTGSLESGNDFIGTHYNAARVPVEIDVSSIDAQVQGGLAPPGFIKIDVEGHEFDVLSGGRETLARHRPAMVIEVSSRQAEVQELLRELDYKLVSPATGQELEHPEFSTGAIPR
jgi:FkbM family methyltransferase